MICFFFKRKYSIPCRRHPGFRNWIMSLAASNLWIALPKIVSDCNFTNSMWSPHFITFLPKMIIETLKISYQFDRRMWISIILISISLNNNEVKLSFSKKNLFSYICLFLFLLLWIANSFFCLFFYYDISILID